MSLITALSYSLSGMRAIQSDMQVISSNVSNAGRADYTKKSIVLTADTTTAEGTGGVSVLGYTRATSNTLSNLLQQSLGDNGLYSTQQDYLQRIQTLMGSTQDSPLLTKAVSDFSAAWQSLAAAPEDTSRQQNVIFTAQNLTREVTRLTEGLDKMKQDLKSDMATATDTLNKSLKRIADLNNEIVTAESAGQSAVDLMDLRDVEVRKIAELTKINVVQRDSGRIALYTPEGLSLLDGVANSFTWNGTNITLDPGGNVMDTVLKGGKIEGLVGMLDQGSSATTLNDPGKASIYKIEQQLNKVVDLFTNASGTFATAYDSATTGTGEQAASFFTGTTRYTFAVNTNLADGSKTVKQAAAAGVAADMTLATRSVSAAGISTTNVSYAGFADSIASTHSQNTAQISGLATIYSGQKDDYTQRFQNDVGVNTDQELVHLTQLQNSYSAVAKVITTIQNMFNVLDQML